MIKTQTDATITDIHVDPAPARCAFLSNDWCHKGQLGQEACCHCLAEKVVTARTTVGELSERIVASRAKG